MIRGILIATLAAIVQTAWSFEVLTVSEFHPVGEESGDRFRLQFSLISPDESVGGEYLYLRSNLESLSARKLQTYQERMAYLDIQVPESGEAKVKATTRRAASVS